MNTKKLNIDKYIKNWAKNEVYEYPVINPTDEELRSLKKKSTWSAIHFKRCFYNDNCRSAVLEIPAHMNDILTHFSCNVPAEIYLDDVDISAVPLGTLTVPLFTARSLVFKIPADLLDIFRLSFDVYVLCPLLYSYIRLDENNDYVLIQTDAGLEFTENAFLGKRREPLALAE